MRTPTICLLLFCFNTYAAETPFKQDPAQLQQALQILNNYRHNAGLKPVTLNADLSDACFKHSRYVAMNKENPIAQSMSPHYENDTLPFATQQGKEAGLASCMAYTEPVNSITEFMSTYYHRMPLIDPNTTEVGIGYYTYDGYTVCCVDMRSKWQWNNDTLSMVVYPPVNGTNVPLYFQDERPNPIPDTIDNAGFPITVQIFGRQQITQVKAVLKDDKGKVLNCVLSTPEEPLTSFPQYNDVCIIPIQPLAAGTTYTIYYTCLLNGKAFRRQWKFSTEAVDG